MAQNYRPLLRWPYYRRPWDFQSHIDDLWFWGYIDVSPFHSQYEEWMNLRMKKQRSKFPHSCKGRRSRFFGKSKYKKDYSKTPRNSWIEFRKKYDIHSFIEGIM